MKKSTVHIFFHGAIAENIINFFNDKLNRRSHTFLIYGKPSESPELKIIHKENVIYFNEALFSSEVEEHIKSARKIVLHSLFNPYILSYFIERPNLINKLVLVFWGGDIKTFFLDSPDPFTSEMNRLKEILIRQVNTIATLVKGDYLLLEGIFNIEYKYQEILYPFNDGGSNLKETIRSGIDRTRVNIQIGNSATPTNRHIEALEIISKFKDESIDVFVPLSYGSGEYAQSVISKGRELFGDKFHPLTEYLPLNEYYNFLKRIDIAIFNNDRQQAIFNIQALLLAGCKVFCRADTPMWPFFTKDWSVHLNSIDDLASMTFEDFICYDKVIAQHNRKTVLQMIDDKRIIKLWNKLLYN